MNNITATEQISRLMQQRNVLSVLVFLLTIANLCLTLVITFKSEKITMLPSNLNYSNYSITNNKADENYLKDRALQISVRLFNLTPENVKKNMEDVLLAVPSSHYSEIRPILIELSKDTLKKSIISSFIIESMVATEEDQSVIIKGKSTKFFGSHPKSAQQAYKLNFRFNGVELQLTGLEELKGM